MKKYIKHNCKYWGHNYNKQPNGLPDFDGYAIDRDTQKSIGRWRKCTRCGHIDIVEGLLIEEVVDIGKTTLKDLPRGFFERMISSWPNLFTSKSRRA